MMLHTNAAEIAPACYAPTGLAALHDEWRGLWDRRNRPGAEACTAEDEQRAAQLREIEALIIASEPQTMHNLAAKVAACADDCWPDGLQALKRDAARIMAQRAGRRAAPVILGPASPAPDATPAGSLRAFAAWRQARASMAAASPDDEPAIEATLEGCEVAVMAAPVLSLADLARKVMVGGGHEWSAGLERLRADAARILSEEEAAAIPVLFSRWQVARRASLALDAEKGLAAWGRLCRDCEAIEDQIMGVRACDAPDMACKALVAADNDFGIEDFNASILNDAAHVLGVSL